MDEQRASSHLAFERRAHDRPECPSTRGPIRPSRGRLPGRRAGLLGGRRDLAPGGVRRAPTKPVAAVVMTVCRFVGIATPPAPPSKGGRRKRSAPLFSPPFEGGAGGVISPPAHQTFTPTAAGCLMPSVTSE